MARFEYMALETVVQGVNSLFLLEVSPSGELNRLGKWSVTLTVETLNRLGAEGWDVVGTDRVHSNRQDGDYRSFWLRRQLD